MERKPISRTENDIHRRLKQLKFQSETTQISIIMAKSISTTKNNTALKIKKPEQDTFTLALKSQTGIIAIKEFKFHDTRNWRFDYCIPYHDGKPVKVAIEVEGGAWTNGRHTRGSGFIKDMDKYNNAALLGYKLLRVTPDKLMSLSTFEMIIQATL